LYDRQIKLQSNTSKVVIGNFLPCDDLKQRLRKIFEIALIRYEEKKKAVCERKST